MERNTTTTDREEQEEKQGLAVSEVEEIVGSKVELKNEEIKRNGYDKKVFAYKNDENIYVEIVPMEPGYAHSIYRIDGADITVNSARSDDFTPVPEKEIIYNMLGISGGWRSEAVDPSIFSRDMWTDGISINSKLVAERIWSDY